MWVLELGFKFSWSQGKHFTNCVHSSFSKHLFIKSLDCECEKTNSSSAISYKNGIFHEHVCFHYCVADLLLVKNCWKNLYVFKCSVSLYVIETDELWEYEGLPSTQPLRVTGLSSLHKGLAF